MAASKFSLPLPAASTTVMPLSTAALIAVKDVGPVLHGHVITGRARRMQFDQYHVALLELRRRIADGAGRVEHAVDDRGMHCALGLMA
jgi:hypothetical protein